MWSRNLTVKFLKAVFLASTLALAASAAFASPQSAASGVPPESTCAAKEGLTSGLMPGPHGCTGQVLSWPSRKSKGDQAAEQLLKDSATAPSSNASGPEGGETGLRGLAGIFRALLVTPSPSAEKASSPVAANTAAPSQQGATSTGGAK